MIKRLVMTVKSLLRRVSGAEEEIMRLEGRVDELERSLEAQTGNVEHYRDVCHQLEMRLRAVRNERNDLSTKKKKLSAENSELRRWNEDLMKRLEELQPEEAVKSDESGLPDDAPIELLELNVQIYLILKNEGINTVGELCGWKMSNLMLYDNFGEARANQVFVALAKHGRRLVPEDDPKQRQKIERILTPGRQKLIKLEDMGLTKRTYNIAGQAGLRTVYDICMYYKWQLREKLRDDETADELVRRVNALGFKMRKGHIS